jgi:hypothetical protein
MHLGFFFDYGRWESEHIGFFLLVSMYSHQVPTKFLMCSQHVPQILNVFMNMFPMFPMAFHFIAYPLP